MSLAKGSPIQYDDVNVLRNTSVISDNTVASNGCGIFNMIYLGKVTTGSAGKDDTSQYVTGKISTNCWRVSRDSDGNLYFDFYDSASPPTFSNLGVIDKS